MKFKLLAVLMVFVLAMSFLAVAGCATDEETADGGQTFTLLFETFWPEPDFQVAEGHKAWANEISERVAAETPHTVEFDFRYSVDPRTLWDNVVAGGTDIVSTCPNYTLGLFPATEAFELPGLQNDNALVASMTIWDAYNQSAVLQDEYTDAKIMHFWATGPGDFLTTTPVREMEDFTGLTIRAVGGSIPWTTALGPGIVSYGMRDVLENFDAGTIDGLLAPTDVLKGFRLAEYVTHVTKAPPAYNIIFMKAMNLNTWNSLPESVQQIFSEVNEKYVEIYGELRTEHTIVGEQYGIDEGIEIIELDAAEYDRWVALYDAVLEDWIEEKDKMGLDGEAILELARELDAMYSEVYGDWEQ